MVEVLAARADALVSRRCAAALLRVDGFSLGSHGLDVCVLGPAANLRSRHANLHRTSFLPPGHRTVVRDLPCTTLPRTYVDLAAVLSGRRLARALDDGLLVRRTTVPEVQRVNGECAASGRRGPSLLRTLLAARAVDGYVPPESQLEREAVAIAVTAGLPVPILQASPPWRTAEQQRLDVLWEEVKLIMECDGRRWHARVEAFEADRRRDRAALRHGYGLIRVTWEDVRLFPDELAADLVAIYLDRKTA